MEYLSKGVRSRAALFGHPLHPMVVPFPIAFLAGALLSDILYWSNGDPYWPSMSVVLIVGALATAVVAAILGLIDFVSIDCVRHGATGWAHMVGNVIVVLLSAFSLIYRLADPAGGVMPVGLAVSVLVAVILVVTTWLGGALVHRRKVGEIERREIQPPRMPATRARAPSSSHPGLWDERHPAE